MADTPAGRPGATIRRVATEPGDGETMRWFFEEKMTRLVVPLEEQLEDNGRSETQILQTLRGLDVMRMEQLT
jgi:hypothetical protein